MSYEKAKEYIKSIENRPVKKRPIIIDCDPGIDDAMALLLLAQFKDNFDIKLITSCAGNIPIDITTKNLQFFAENFFNGVRIAKGSRIPLVKKPINAVHVHGKNGLGSYEIPEQNYPYDNDAVESMYDVLNNSQEKITLVTLGPMTNIAKLMIRYPEVKEKIDVIYSMIGSIDGTGNMTDYSEFNAYYDPEAFDIVVKCNIPMIINPMQLGNETRVKKSVFANMPTETIKDNLVKTMAESVNSPEDNTCICLYDPNTIVGLIKPEYYDYVPCEIHVYTYPDMEGKTVLKYNPDGIHKYQVVKNMDKLNDFIITQLFKD